jgi:peptide/nickel transport system permease protein
LTSPRSSSAVDERAETAARATRSGRRLPPLVRYIAIRFGLSIVLLIGVTIITFVLTNLVPASPVTAALGERAAGDPKIVEAFKKAQGLDQPLPVQYFVYLGHVLQGNLGTSIGTRNPVTQDLAYAFPATAELAIFAIVVAVVIGLVLAIVAALRQNRFSDQLIRAVSVVGISVPTFWLAVAAYFLFFFVLHWAPGSGRLSAFYDPPPRATGLFTIDALIAGQPDVAADAFAHLVLPGCVLAVYTLGLLVRFARSSILDVLNQDYVRAARAKGLSPLRVVTGYLLRGALLPILTIVGLAFGSLLSGAVLTEQVFSWGGIGQYAYRAATSLDLPSIMGVGLIVGVVYITVNFVIDLVYGFVDPRVRVG